MLPWCQLLETKLREAKGKQTASSTECSEAHWTQAPMVKPEAGCAPAQDSEPLPVGRGFGHCQARFRVYPKCKRVSTVD